MKAWAILLSLLAAKLIFLKFSFMDLSFDEAQYWLWSRTPDFGYYSKPPVVAWAIALTTGLSGQDGEFFVRLASPLFHFGAGVFIYLLAENLYDKRIAALSAVSYSLLPGVVFSSAIISTDPPLLFFWAGALYFFRLALATDRALHWVSAGLTAGLGMLAKYSMIIFLPSALIYLFIQRKLPRGFILSAACAFAVFLPNLWWNYNNGFVSFLHTRDNANLSGPLFNPVSALEFLLAQMGIMGPVLFFIMIYHLAVSRKRDERENFLLCFFLPFFAAIFLQSILSRAHGNWAAPAFASAVIYAVAKGRERLILISLALCGALSLAFYFSPFLAGGKLKADFTARTSGNSAFGREISGLLAKRPGTTLLSDNRKDLATLSYYVLPHPPAMAKWNDRGVISDHFDMRYPLNGKGNFLLVTSTEDVSSITKTFSRATPLPPVSSPLFKTRNIYMLEGFTGYK